MEMRKLTVTQLPDRLVKNREGTIFCLHMKLALIQHVRLNCLYGICKDVLIFFMCLPSETAQHSQGGLCVAMH